MILHVHQLHEIHWNNTKYTFMEINYGKEGVREGFVTFSSPQSLI